MLGSLGPRPVGRAVGPGYDRAKLGLSMVLLLLLSILSGCSERTSMAMEMINVAMGNDESANVSRADIEALPYASLYGRIGRAPRAFVILARQQDNRDHWITANYTAIVTEHGRLVETARLPVNLRETRFLQPDPLAFMNLRQPPPRKRYARSIDVGPDLAYDLLLQCTWTNAGDEVLSIESQSIATRRWDEQCEAQGRDWTFQNSFWVAMDTGVVWQSVQHFSPAHDPLEVQILKPPAT